MRSKLNSAEQLKTGGSKMNIGFLWDMTSLLMQWVLNTMMMHGVSPLVDNNIVAYLMHMLAAR